jgi:hypothetical protein
MKHIKKFNSINEESRMDSSTDPKSFLSGVVSGFGTLLYEKLSGEDKALADKYMALLPIIIFANYHAETFTTKGQELLANLSGSDIMKKNPGNLSLQDLSELLYLSNKAAGRSGKTYGQDLDRHLGKPYQSEMGDEPATDYFRGKK